MNKPLSVARVEFISLLTEITADSGLPSFMLADIFKDAYSQSLQLAMEQYEKDLKEWQKEQDANKEEKKEVE